MDPAWLGPGFEQERGRGEISQDPTALLRESLEPIKRRKIYAEVASQIHRLIEDGRLKPGDRLPPERDLAETFGVSRTSVRDAIRVLEMRGLVEPRHGEGTIVREVPIDAIVSPLADALAMSKNLTADLFDMRKMLEPPLARAAAIRATAEDLLALRKIMSRQDEQNRNGKVAIAEDTAFHYQIATAAKNQVVLRVIDVIMDLLRESRARSLQGHARAERSLAGHRRIFTAIQGRDPEAAAEAMRLHIEEIESLQADPRGDLARAKRTKPGAAVTSAVGASGQTEEES